MAAFFEEMDILYTEVENVYFGRFLEFAFGVQLDIVGEIVGQPRSIVLPTSFFGFQGVLNVDGMADEATPNLGGLFLDEAGGSGADVTPLTDTVYARLIKTRAMANLMETIDIESAYALIRSLLDRQPSVMSISVTGIKEFQLTMAEVELSELEQQLLVYASRFFVPLGTTFLINLV